MKKVVKHFVYQLIDPRNGLPFYIGMSYRKRRPLEHIAEAKKGKLSNKHLQRKILKILREDKEIRFYVVFSSPDREEVALREKQEIANWRSLIGDDLTNKSDGGDGVLYGEDSPRYGKPLPETAKEKFRTKMKGRPKTEEHKRKISNTLKGKMVGPKNPNYKRSPSLEKRAFLSLFWLGKRKGEDNPSKRTDVREKISKAKKGVPNLKLRGHKRSEETRAKMRKSKLLLNFKWSDEMKQYFSQLRKGTKLTEEHKKKIGDAERGEKHWNFGGHRSEDVKQKISKSLKGKMVGDKNPFYGKTFSEKSKKQWAASRLKGMGLLPQDIYRIRELAARTPEITPEYLSRFYPELSVNAIENILLYKSYTNL